MAHDDVIRCQENTEMDTELVKKFRKAHTSFSRAAFQQTSSTRAQASNVRQQHRTPRRTEPSVKAATAPSTTSAADVWETEARQATRRPDHGRLTPPPSFEGWNTPSKAPTVHQPRLENGPQSISQDKAEHAVQQSSSTGAALKSKPEQKCPKSSQLSAALDQSPAARTAARGRSADSPAARADNKAIPTGSNIAPVRAEVSITKPALPVSQQAHVQANYNIHSCERDQTTSKPLHASVLRVKGSSPPNKMASSSDDDHDVVMMKGRNSNRAQGINRPANLSQLVSKRGSPQAHGVDSMQSSSRSNTRRGGPRRNNASAAQTSNNSPQATATTDTAGCKVAPPEIHDELEKYRREIVRHAHLNRFGAADLPAGNAEALEKVRKGPAFDSSSEDYKLVASFRKLPVAPPYEYPRGFVTNRHDRDHKEECAVYAATSRVYPRVVDGHIELLTVPQAGQVSQPDAARHRTTHEDNVGQSTILGGEVPAENRWATSYYADWQWRPQSVSNYEAFRDTFRSWLNESMALPCLADIYHESFFNGVAHPDGVQGFLLPDLEDYPTFPDPSDEETSLHRDESATAYSINFTHHENQQRQSQAARSGYARASYLSSSTPLSPSTLPSPRGPKSPLANVYLRPAEVGDIPELMDFSNWYIRNSDLSVYADLLDAGDIRQRLDNCRQQNLPFIVAAERRFGTGARPVETPEKIYGYALARDSTGVKTTGRFTAELELFVRAEEKRKGIGRCLMDKLIEVCDATYNAKKGYFFDSDIDERTAYTPGGRRKLARIMFILAFSDDDTSHYQWVKNWLKDQFGFEEQGVLRGARVKSDRFLNTSYLVREVGHSSGRSFKNW